MKKKILASLFVLILLSLPISVSATDLYADSYNVEVMVDTTKPVIATIPNGNGSNIFVRSQNTAVATVTAFECSEFNKRGINITGIKVGKCDLILRYRTEEEIKITVNVIENKETPTMSAIEKLFQKTLGKVGETDDSSTSDNAAAKFNEFYANTIMAFGSVEEAIKNSQTHFSYIDVPNIAGFLNKFFMPLAYALLFLSWCVSMGKRGISLDLYEPKDFVKASVRVIVGLMVITISTPLLELIFSLTNGITADLLVAGGEEIAYDVDGIELAYEISKVWVIGPIITFLNFLSSLPAALIVALLNIIIFLIIEVVLCMRLIKIAIFQGVSPLMFGLVGGESTMPMFKNFIIEYIKLAFQGVIIAVVFYIYKKACTSGFLPSILAAIQNPSTIWGSLLYPVIMLSLAIMVLKSDKLLDRIIGRA